MNNMNLEILIIYSIYNNSSFSHNDSYLTEFSETFIKEEIKNIHSKNVIKINFDKSIKNLESNGFLSRSSKHHLTTLNSWRITKKLEIRFREISKNQEINLNFFENFVG
tara:strand:- start:848 stop:1174 length:327 start_codon:yes stop_codon:yes gene_type:complete